MSKLSIERFKLKNVAIKPSKRQKIPNQCFECKNLSFTKDGYGYCGNKELMGID